jgi:hypothetical protein
MKRVKCLRTTQKALDRGPRRQRRGAAEAYMSVSKTFDTGEFCFSGPLFSILLGRAACFPSNMLDYLLRHFGLLHG